MIRSAILATTVAIGFAQAASAQTVLYSTSFQAPTYTDGILNGSADTTTPGQDGWIITSGGQTNPITVSNSATNGMVSLTTNGQDVRRIFNGGAAAAVTSGSVFLDAHVTVNSALTGDYALHLGDGSTTLFYDRVFFKAGTTGFVMALGTSSGTTPTYGTTEFPFGTAIHVLARYDFVPGAANDTGALFINPTTFDGSGDTPYVAATTQGADATSIDAVYLRQGAAASSPTLTVDDMQAFVTTSVPEPSSLSLLGVAGVGLVVRRYRRKAG
jgi:hypothetical protein